MTVQVSLNGKIVDMKYANCQIFYRFLDADQVPHVECKDVKGCWETGTNQVSILLAEDAVIDDRPEAAGHEAVRMVADPRVPANASTRHQGPRERNR